MGQRLYAVTSTAYSIGSRLPHLTARYRLATQLELEKVSY